MPKLLVDTHVHIYPDYNVSLLLNSALRNFQAAASGSNRNYFVLALTERFDCNFFKSHLETKWHGKWELKRTSDLKLICAQKAEDRIYILPGRQNISEEKLEILTLGSDDFRAEGLPATEIIKGSMETGLVTVLPWSFGKWWGKRGKLVEKLISDSTLKFSLGEPAHRFGIEPKLFSKAKILNRNLLHGTDPLPLANEESRVAQYGSIFEIEEGELSYPKIIEALIKSPSRYGERTSFASSLLFQLKLRSG